MIVELLLLLLYNSTIIYSKRNEIVVVVGSANQKTRCSSSNVFLPRLNTVHHTAVQYWTVSYLFCASQKPVRYCIENSLYRYSIEVLLMYDTTTMTRTTYSIIHQISKPVFKKLLGCVWISFCRDSLFRKQQHHYLYKQDIQNKCSWWHHPQVYFFLSLINISRCSAGCFHSCHTHP